jgi:hypothetical protein
MLVRDNSEPCTAFFATTSKTRGREPRFVTDTRTNTITSSDGRKFVIKPDSAQETPKYPTEPPTGPRHTVKGVLRGVHCGYPSVLTLNVDQSGKAQPVFLYRNNFNQIDFTAANFTPKSDLNPCTDLEGLKAKVQYAEVSDKSGPARSSPSS